MLRLRYAGIAVASLAALGCSPVKDSSNVPDAPIDSTDDRPPMIEASTPANMGTKVSVLTNISVFFDEQLDPDTVSATTVKLGYNQTIPTALFPPPFDILRSHGGIPAGLTQIKGTVSYDPIGSRVSFVPATPLPYGYVLVLEFDVKDKGGVAFTGNLTFMTNVNAQTKQYSYNPTSGVPSSSLVWPVDMNGRFTKRVGSAAAGTDTIWFTPDDPKNQHVGYSYAADGRLQDERTYAVGSDGLWDTGDDQTSICVRYAYDTDRRVTERTYATGTGPDTQWCTPDDAVVVNTVYQYMAGTMTGWVYNTAPGTDNTWHTTDDRCYANWEYIYDAQGRKTREILRYCGADFLPKTTDDTFGYYQDYEYDAAGNVTKFTYHASAGGDTIWLNDDDPPQYVDRWIRNADGLVTDFYHSTGSGTDTAWGTPDDPGTYTATTYNMQKLPDEVTTYTSFGGDGVWGGTDDVISSYMKTTYDTLGNRVDQKTYVAGADNTWKTPDDRVVTDNDFDLAH